MKANTLTVWLVRRFVLRVQKWNFVQKLVGSAVKMDSDPAFKDSQCVVFFLCVVCSDRPGVTQHSVVDELQETLTLTLNTYISVKRSDPQKQ